jgi:hypothetical protein
MAPIVKKPGRPEKFAKFAGKFPIKRAKRVNDNAIPMTLEEFGQAEYAVEQALEFGNYGPLKERLRTPGAKLPLELSIAADIIERKIKRPSHRIPQRPEDLRAKRMYLALCVRVMMDQGNPLKAAVADVANESRVSPSKVYTAVRENPDLFIGCSYK